MMLTVFVLKKVSCLIYGGCWRRFFFVYEAVFLFFRFDEEVTLGKLQISELLAHLRVKHLEEFGSYEKGEPMFTTAESVLEFREGL